METAPNCQMLLKTSLARDIFRFYRFNFIERDKVNKLNFKFILFSSLFNFYLYISNHENKIRKRISATV